MTLATNGLNPGTKIYTWTYADAAARTGASGFVAGDVGSVALQLDDGSLWRLTATTPTWQAFSGGFANPMTTAGDIIYGGASGVPTRLAKGGNNTVLGVDGAGVFGYKADPSGAATPEAWHVVGAGGEPAFLNSYANFNAATHQAATFRKEGDRVYVRGLVASGADNAPLFTLPTGYRPPTIVHFPVVASGAYGQIEITTAGDVLHDIGSRSYFSINCDFSVTA